MPIGDHISARLRSTNRYNIYMAMYNDYSPALKKLGYTGFGLYFRGSVRTDSVVPISIYLFPLNILRTNGRNLTQFGIHIHIDKI